MKAVFFVPDPLEAVTVTATVPEPAGVFSVIWVALCDVNDVTAVAPKVTLVGVVRLDPVIVTTVPPAALPLAGETVVIVGPAV